MQCPSCSAQVLDGSAFCSECGATVAAAPAGVGSQQYNQGYAAGGYAPPQQAAYAPPPGYAQQSYQAPPQAQWQPQTPAGDFNLIEALQRPTKDPDFVKKIAIMALVSLVPIVSFLGMGYALRYLQNLIGRRDARLPEWEDWGGLFIGGLMLFVLSLPFVLVPAVVGGAVVVPAFITAVQHESAAGIVGSIFGGLALFAVLAVIFGIPVPMAICRYADKGDLMQALRLNVLLGLVKANLVQYILIFAAIFGLGIVTCMVAAIPIVGWLAAIVMGAGIHLAAYSAFSDYYIRYKPD